MNNAGGSSFIAGELRPVYYVFEKCEMEPRTFMQRFSHYVVYAS